FSPPKTAICFCRQTLTRIDCFSPPTAKTCRNCWIARRASLPDSAIIGRPGSIHDVSRAKATRAVICASFAVLLSVFSIAAAQHPTIEAWVSGRTLTRGVEWSNPALKLNGTIEAEQGHRLYLVEVRIGATDVAAELDTFRLAADGVEHVAI